MTTASKQIAAVAATLSLSATTMLAQDRSQSRSMVASQSGIVASESVLASQVGARILESGGNAIDAAVATNAMMGLVAPMNDGIGGDLFAIVYIAKTGKLYGLNASGWAPTALTPEFLAAKGIKTMPQKGIHSVTVPGAVDGWDKLLKRFGTKTFADVLAPSIRYAETGFPIGEVVSVYWRDSEKVLREDAPTARVYLPGGRLPIAGEVFQNPDLAWSYRQIATAGRDAFYKGAVAKKIVATSMVHGGTMKAADLNDYQSEWVDPISTSYRGWTVYELPPNGQGIAALEMLNIMERFPIAEMGHNSVRALHTMIEAKKLAYADMIRYDADPRFAKIPVEGLRSKDFAATRATLINAAKANCDVPAGTPPSVDNGTTYLSVVDREGNMASLRAALAGDIVFNGVHPWLGASDEASRTAWRAAVKRISDLHPSIVVAGHKKDVNDPDSPDALTFMNRYLSDFDAARKTASNADDLRTAMLQKYPDLAVRGLLAFGARAAFQK